MTQVTFKRPHAYENQLVDYTIYVGSKQYKISDAKEIQIPLTEGKHEVKVKMQWYETKFQIEVNQFPSSYEIIPACSVENRATKIPFLVTGLFLLFAFLLPTVYKAEIVSIVGLMLLAFMIFQNKSFIYYYIFSPSKFFILKKSEMFN